MKQSPWNNPSETWRLASFEPPTERRKASVERRESSRRATIGERRLQNRRSLRSLFRL